VFSTTADGANTYSERMRITKGGDVLVGTTTNSISSEGIVFHQNKYIGVARDGAITMYLNRITDDGTILEFRKDNSNNGHIGVRSGDIYIGTGDTGMRFYDAGDAIIPVTTAGATSDAARDLGYSSIRWRNLYLSGGAYLGGSTGANRLDDYEEGVFSASMVPSTAGTITLNGGVFKLAYTKVGRKVHIQGLLETTSKSSPSGKVEIRNLPFTAVDGEQYTGRCGGGMRITNVEGTGNVGKAYSWYILEGGTTINVDIDASTVHPGGSPAYSQFYISLTYMTS
jgi:hypothetical protein